MWLSLSNFNDITIDNEANKINYLCLTKLISFKPNKFIVCIEDILLQTVAQYVIYIYI